MMNHQDEIEAIGRKARSLSPPLELTIHPAGEDTAFEASLVKVADLLDRAGGEGTVLGVGKGEGLPAVPALSFRRPGTGELQYLALPEGHQAGPFEEFVTQVGGDAADGGDDWTTRLRAIEEPAELWVFVASACPHCPWAVRSAGALTFLSGRISVAVIDAQRFPGLAERFRIQSVPVTVLDRGLRRDGSISAEELGRLILARGSDAYEEELFLSLVTAGNIDAAAGRLLDSEPCRAAFVSAWAASTLNLRMGLMLVAGEVLGKNPAALDAVVGEFAALLRTPDVALRGDTADLLGQIAHTGAREALQALRMDPDSDVREIAGEALDGLSRSDGDPE
jgi:hypothetical protein